MAPDRKFRVLITDKLAQQGIDLLKADPNFEVDVRLKIAGEDLKKALLESDALIVRSETKARADVLEGNTRLKVIARAGVGIDNVEVPVATKNGILVMNAPDSVTIAAAEQAMALMLAVARNVAAACASTKSGKWERGHFMGTELNGKTLGVVGMGRIGGEVVKRAVAFGMKVIVSDPMVNPDKIREFGAEPATLDEIYAKSDYITLHAPMTPETKGMLNAATFAKMKKGVRIINCSRGGAIVEADLVEAVKSGQVAAAGLDVFEKEPTPPDNPLLTLDKVTVAPHLGASTEEAQVNVAIIIAEQVRDYLLHGAVRNAVNVPATSPETLRELGPYADLVRRMGSFLIQMLSGVPRRIFIEYRGDIAKRHTGLLTSSAVTGVLSHALEGRVNEVNAHSLAKERGIEVESSKSSEARDFASLVTLTVTGEAGTRSAEGTVIGKDEPHIVAVDGLHLDMVPEGTMITFQNTDKPGIVGKVGTILGKSSINIASLHVGRKAAGKPAVSIFSVDGQVPAGVVKELGALEELSNVRVVHI